MPRDFGLVTLLMGRGVLITGVEDQPDGSTRVYVGARYNRVYFDEPVEAVEEARSAWNSTTGHVFCDRNEIPPTKQEPRLDGEGQP